MRRYCPRCKRERDVRFFNHRNKKKGTYQGYCRDCQRTYFAGYAPKKAAQRAAAYAALQAQVYALKAQPCMDCGRTYPPYVMDFDHRPGAVKVAKVSTLMIRADPRALDEATKCDVVCANCHRVRTYARAKAAA